MKTAERKNRILAYLKAMQRNVSIEELSSIFQVSSVTIRRDLQELEEKKLIIRTHGGCMNAGRTFLETEYHKKVMLNFHLKHAIGKRASKEVANGEMILVDDGSTTFHLGTHLSSFTHLRVYTNSLALISELSRYPAIEFSLLGGIVDPERYSVTGFLTEKIIEQLRFDKVFMGVDAIDAEGRCFVKNEKTARIAQIMIRSAKEKILLSDHTKTGHDTNYMYGTLDNFDKWITTPGVNNKLSGRYKKMTNIIQAQL